MHRFEVCQEGQMVSACVEITDGKIQQSRKETCKCCGNTKFVTEMVAIE